MNVIVTVSRAERGTYMKTFTIDADNNISVFTSKKEAAAASATPFDPFTTPYNPAIDTKSVIAPRVVTISSRETGPSALRS